MTRLFKKLNLGTAKVVHVINAPSSFESELASLAGIDVMPPRSGYLER